MENRFKLRFTFSFIFILVIIAALLRFMVEANDFLCVKSETIDSTSHLSQIVSGDVYLQEITCTENYLDSIQLYLATYDRTNNCSMTVELIDEGNAVIQTWNFDCKLLKDNSYYTLKLDKRIKNSRGDTYFLRITSDAEKGNAVTVRTNNTGDATGLTYNGTDLNISLCYQLVYQYPAWTLWNNSSNALHLNVLIILSIVLFTLIHVVRNMNAEKAFLTIWIPLCIMYLFSSAIFNVPDEEAHFYRAYEISLGYVSSQINETETNAGRSLPLDVELDLLETSWDSFSENSDMTLSDEWVFKTFYNTAAYSPVSYIPQVIGIFLARHLTDKIVIIAYAGRIANLIAITFIMYFAIKNIPCGKNVLALIFFIPMNVYESVSLSPDGMVTALSAFMVAYVLYIRYDQEESLRKQQIFLLYVMAIAISLIKIVYLPFCLIYFLIPSVKFGGIRQKTLHAFFVAGLTIECSLIWLTTAGNYLMHAGTDGTIQIRNIFLHPFNYLLIVSRTFFNNGETYVMRMLGDSLAELNVDTSSLIMLLYGIMLVIVYSSVKRNSSREQIIQQCIFGIVTVCIIILIATSLYVQWTVVNNSAISGIQGRYFLPLLLPLYFTINECNKPAHTENLGIGNGSIVVGASVCACISLLFACLVTS